MVNPKALIHLMKHHLAQADDYKSTGDALLERMKDWETLAALVLAAAPQRCLSIDRGAEDQSCAGCVGQTPHGGR
ncbi:hypothetical protein [Allokutzneria albata]|uniref:hypothetical protein n=1 Tax=Allokutzneria albata TaxID=211114 RepID=UPI0012DE3873|nr:hypothetical protein [Allokutzneria albata]